MTRRQVLQCGAAAPLAHAGQQREPAVVSAASPDKTPRVALVLSSFKGGADHDGTAAPGLAEPRPVDAELTASHLDALLRKAIELAEKGGKGALRSVIGPDDWVVIKPNLVSCHGLNPNWVPGLVTDPRIVRSLIEYLVEHKCGARITVAEGAGEWRLLEKSKAATDGWTTTWGGAFGGLSYRGMVADLARRHPGMRIEIVDLNFDDAVELPVPGKVYAKNNRDGLYWIPKTIQQCDRLISLSPLKTNSGAGVSLSMKNYFGIGPGAQYGFPKLGLHKLGEVHEVLVDLFSFHPADYAILGGCYGIEGAGRNVHFNAMVAGASAVAVDSAGAALMGVVPAALPFLKLAWAKGFGTWEPGSIWVRGNENARRKFEPSLAVGDGMPKPGC